MLRIMKVMLVFSVAAYCLLGMLANVAGFSHTLFSISGVVSMLSVPGGAARWQATTSPIVVVGAALMIVSFKIIAGLVCLAGAWRMWTVRRADVATFAHAKTLALLGCAVAIFGLHFCWVVIGEQVFDLWRSTIFASSANTAFRYGAYIALIAIFVGMGEGETGRIRPAE